MRHGTLADITRRLWAKIEVDAGTGCWNWVGYLDEGYGRTTCFELFGDRRPRGTHVVMYVLFKEPVEAGFHLHHQCENPRCCNPEHLTPLPAGEHTREHAGELCPRGHGPEHWRLHKTAKGGLSRQCRECDRLRQIKNRDLKRRQRAVERESRAA
jgi:hypothetical protein